MKYIFLLLLSLLLFSCEEEIDPIIIPDIESPDENKTPENLTEAEIRRHIEAQLSISATEKYSIKFYEEQLTIDDSIDQIVTVNLLDRALNDAIISGKTAKKAEFGFMGNYNYFFYIDGKTKAITSPVVVPSSPKAELEINFIHLISNANFDFTVDLRIKNSCFRKFYMIENSAPWQVSETEIFTEYGEPDAKFYFVQLEEGTYSLAKNIVIYEGETDVIEFDDPDKIYSTPISISPTKQLVRRWYFSNEYMKYYVRNDEL